MESLIFNCLFLIVVGSPIAMLIGCSEDYNNPYDPKNANDDYDKDGIPNKDEPAPRDVGSGGTSTSSTTTNTSGSGTTAATAKRKALSFGQSVKFDGVQSIYGATLMDGTIYLIGKNTDENYVLGKYTLATKSLLLTPKALLSNNGITVSGMTSLATNTDEIYIADLDNNLIKVDKTTLKAVSEVHSECTGYLFSSFYLKDGRWNNPGGRLYVCGVVDGATINTDPTIDPTTGAAPKLLSNDSYAHFSFDGTYIYQYVNDVGGTASNSLVIFNGDFSLKAQYPTSGYPYLSNSVESHSTVLSDGDGGMLFFGCDISRNCYMTPATIVEQ